MIQFIAFGGAPDPKRERPPIGGSEYAFVDWDSKTVLLVDCGAYNLSAKEREWQSRALLSPASPVFEYEILGGQRFPIWPKVRSIAQYTEENAVSAFSVNDEEVLRGMREIYVVASHGHADHIGALPFLKRRFPEARIIMSKETLEIALWSWYDSFRVAASEKRQLPFDAIDVRRVQKSIEFVAPFGSFTAGPFHVEFFPAGHILGALCMKITHGSLSVFVSGDISFKDQRTMNGASLPPGLVDYVVSESTYAGNVGISRDEAESQMLAHVRQVLAGGGKVLFPALAVGRSSEVFSILEAHGITKEYGVYLDGSACRLAKIYAGHGVLSPSVVHHFVDSSSLRQEIIHRDRPLVVIAPSGMLSGGRAVQYTRAWASDPRNLIAFSSYQDPCSPGHRLRDVMRGERVFFFGEMLEFNAKIGNYTLSAHMDGSELTRMIDRMRPKKAFLVHGEEAGIDMVVAEFGGYVEKTFLNQAYSL